MTRSVVLLRGVNVGGHNRISMPDLRAALEGLGCREVQTYVQSGNAVVRHDVDGDSQERLELLPKAPEREQPGVLGQVHEQVEVGAGSLLAAGDAAEYPQVADAVLRGQRQHRRQPAAQPVPDRAGRGRGRCWQRRA